MSTMTTIGELTSLDIGKVVRMRTILGRARVEAVVEGELRGVAHEPNRSIVNVTSPSEHNGFLFKVIAEHGDDVELCGAPSGDGR